MARTKTMKQNASLAFEPLYRLAQSRSGLADGVAGEAAHLGFTFVLFADMVGQSEKAVRRWRDEGRIPWISADRAAIALGYHPIEVWGDEWLNVKGDYAQIAAGQLDKVIDKALDDMTVRMSVGVEDAVAAEVVAAVSADDLLGPDPFGDDEYLDAMDGAVSLDDLGGEW